MLEYCLGISAGLEILITPLWKIKQLGEIVLLQSYGNSQSHERIKPEE